MRAFELSAEDRLAVQEAVERLTMHRAARNESDLSSVRNCVESAVEAITQAAINAALNDAADAIESTGSVCISAHGDRCVGGIAYRDAARIVRARTH